MKNAEKNNLFEQEQERLFFGLSENIKNLENIGKTPNTLSILIEEIIALEDEVFKNNLIQKLESKIEQILNIRYQKIYAEISEKLIFENYSDKSTLIKNHAQFIEFIQKEIKFLYEEILQIIKGTRDNAKNNDIRLYFMDIIENFVSAWMQEINFLNQKLENPIQLENSQLALAEIPQLGAEKLNDIETEKNILNLSQKIKRIYFENYLTIKLNQWINACLKPIKSAINLNSNAY